MVSKLRLVLAIPILFLSFYGTAQRDYWKQEVAHGNLKKSISNRFEVQKGAVFSFEEDVLKNKLRNARFSKSKYTTVQFPNERGELISFTVMETPVLSKELAAKYPPQSFQSRLLLSSEVLGKKGVSIGINLGFKSTCCADSKITISTSLNK